jgi:hypothetical protein
VRAGAAAALTVTLGGLYVESSISTHDLGRETDRLQVTQYATCLCGQRLSWKGRV